MSIEERRNAESYFMDQGQEPVFHMPGFDPGQFGKPAQPTQFNHREGTTTPSLSSVLSHGYKDRFRTTSMF